MLTIEELSSQLSDNHEPQLINDGKECLRVYNKLKEINNGSVWKSEIQILFDIRFIGVYPNARKVYSLSKIGKIFLKGINIEEKGANEKVKIQSVG